MQHLVPAHVRSQPGTRSPVPADRPAVDAEALAVLHRAARALMAGLPELGERLVDLLVAREPAYRAAMEADEIDSLAARLEARADITDDVIHQKTDLCRHRVEGERSRSMERSVRLS